jgi:molybdopterin synthase catalytic subunit
VLPPESGDEWFALTSDHLAVGDAYDWCVRPDCGAVVLFSGIVRDHAVDADGAVRTDVLHLDYEAYEGAVVEVFSRIAAEARGRWPHTGRIAIWHRVGRLGLGESSVVVAVSSPHRPEAFETGRYLIDAVKMSAPIWKRESWEDDAGTQAAWGTNAHDITDPRDVPVATFVAAAGPAGADPSSSAEVPSA